jgi:hypothetical protein
VVKAEKANDIEEAGELEDYKGEETGTELQVPNNLRWNSIPMGLEEINMHSLLTL